MSDISDKIINDSEHPTITLNLNANPIESTKSNKSTKTIKTIELSESSKVADISKKIEIKPGSNIYLHPSDEYLLKNDMNIIVGMGNELFNNLQSHEMKEYNRLFNLIYQKYSTKKYIIYNENGYIKVMYNQTKKALKKEKLSNEIIIHIVKPIYENIEKTLDELKIQINEQRNILNASYMNIIHKTDLTPHDKDEFTNIKNNFIKLLHKYYSIIIYTQLLNNNNNNNNNDIDNNNINLKDISSVSISQISSKIEIDDTNIYYKPIVENIIFENNINTINQLLNNYEILNIEQLNKYHELLAIINNNINKPQSTEYIDKIKDYINLSIKYAELDLLKNTQIDKYNNNITYFIKTLPKIIKNI